VTYEPRDVAFYDAAERDGRPPPRVRDMTVGPVTTNDVDEFARRYHYSGRGGSMLWRYGLWHDFTLWGVCVYNLPTRHVCEAIFGPDHFDRVVHMGRLAMADGSPRNSESRLIGGSLAAMTRDHPDIWAVVTYAATEVGHLGYVYQATNALYTGTGGDPIFHIDTEGNRRGTYDGRHINRAEAERRGWTRHTGGSKHRYVYLLGSKTQRRQRRALLRLDVLPYPKVDGLDDEA